MRLGDGIPVRLPSGKHKQDRLAERSGGIGVAQVGLAAAAVSKPTIAHYMRYFRHLYTAVCTNGTGLYGDALSSPAIDVDDNFPEKAASRESWLYLLSPLHSALTVGFGSAAAANPITRVSLHGGST